LAISIIRVVSARLKAAGANKRILFDIPNS
jgi:hypothetical protein